MKIDLINICYITSIFTIINNIYIYIYIYRSRITSQLSPIFSATFAEYNFGKNNLLFNRQ